MTVKWYCRLFSLNCRQLQTRWKCEFSEMKFLDTLVIFLSVVCSHAFDYKFTKIENCTSFNENIIKINNFSIGTDRETLEVSFDIKKPLTQILVCKRKIMVPTYIERTNNDSPIGFHHDFHKTRFWIPTTVQGYSHGLVFSDEFCYRCKLFDKIFYWCV